MLNDKKIESYFNDKKASYHAMAEFHKAEAKKATSEFMKKFHEDRAWICGVSMPAVLDGLKKDLKILV